MSGEYVGMRQPIGSGVAGAFGACSRSNEGAEGIVYFSAVL
jgi:hypothetical protein